MFFYILISWHHFYMQMLIPISPWLNKNAPHTLLNTYLFCVSPGLIFQVKLGKGCFFVLCEENIYSRSRTVLIDTLCIHQLGYMDYESGYNSSLYQRFPFQVLETVHCRNLLLGRILQKIVLTPWFLPSPQCHIMRHKVTSWYIAYSLI